MVGVVPAARAAEQTRKVRKNFRTMTNYNRDRTGAASPQIRATLFSMMGVCFDTTSPSTFRARPAKW